MSVTSDPTVSLNRIIAIRMAAFFVPLILVILLDRVSKNWVRATIWDPPRTVIVVPGWLEFTPVTNRGIAFGLLQDSGGVLALGAVILLTIVAIKSWRQVLHAPALTRIPLGLIGGGAVGNLVDRALDGFVTDFLRVPHIQLFQVFNVADASIVVGTAALAIGLWFGQRTTAAPPAPAPSTDATPPAEQ